MGRVKLRMNASISSDVFAYTNFFRLVLQCSMQVGHELHCMHKIANKTKSF